jgi:hypothetical protein
MILTYHRQTVITPDSNHRTKEEDSTAKPIKHTKERNITEPKENDKMKKKKEQAEKQITTIIIIKL